MNNRFYIRFGEIPKTEKSKIYRNGDKLIGEEPGVSVYDAVFYDEEWKIIYPNPSTQHTAQDINDFVLDIARNNSFKRQAYLVSGDKVGIGQDGEPLIINVKIIQNITSQFGYDLENDIVEEQIVETISEALD